jgi:hypothetical protein
MFDENVVNLIRKWATAGEKGIEAAVRLSRDLVFFRPDPQEKEKLERRKEDPSDWTASLEANPPFQDFEYARILDRAVRPLAEAAPLPTARLLIEAAANMVSLELGRRADEVDEGRNDPSEIWCPLLNAKTRPYSDSKGDLIRTLTFACEQVYSRGDRDEIAHLDRVLREPKWYLFDRIRFHLYTRHAVQAEQWIREEISRYDRYGQETYGFEFQQMLRIAAEEFGERLLPRDELQKIFDAILTAPDKEDYRQFMAEQFTEEGYRARQGYFQLRQFRPFAKLLFGKYAERYDKLRAASPRELTDEDFIRYQGGESKTGASRSPKSTHELAVLTDDELVTFLNDWEEVGRDPEQWWVDIDFTGLATAFRQLIIEDPDRFLAWKDRWQTLLRPIYLRFALEAAAQRIGEHQSELPIWLEVAAWVMSRTDSQQEGDRKPSDTSRERPDWSWARRQVVDLISTCIGKDVDVSLDYRSKVFSLLSAASIAPDYILDRDQPVVTPRDYLTDAINTTRGRALENLLQYGFWVRRHIPDDNVEEIFAVLEKRFAGTPPLALAEHALLGASFHQIYGLSASRAADLAASIFPQDHPDRWASAFSAYVSLNRAHVLVFEIFRPHLEFALDELQLLKLGSNPHNDAVAHLGEHLLDYFMLGLIERNGGLLQRYYAKTTENYWAALFDHVGRLLSHTSVLKPDVAERIKSFFEARLVAANPEELKEFTFWLKAECLDAQWRVEAFRRTLAIAKGGRHATSIVTDDLAKLVAVVPDLVVRAFADLTENLMTQSYFYLRPERVKIILNAGLRSKIPETVQAANFARDNLLKAGRTEYRDLDAIKDDPHWLPG